MTAWFLHLTTGAQLLFGLGFPLVIVGICLLLAVIDSAFQRRQDRANVPAETVVLPRVDTAALKRHLVRYGDDTIDHPKQGA